MLESLIGRKALQESLKDILTKNQTGFIDTEKFEEILKKLSKTS